MKIVVTIIGQDRVGIVAKVSTALAAANINILDINQNIIHGFFNMVMIAEMPEGGLSIRDAQAKMKALGDEIGVEIAIQHEKIFDAMHRI